jgi:hypothetical protein
VLALRAEVSAATGEQNPLYRSAANKTRLARPHIDFVLQLEKAAHAIRINVIRNRRTTEFDRMP